MDRPRTSYCWSCGYALHVDTYREESIPKWTGDNKTRILHKSCFKKYEEEVNYSFDVEVHDPEYRDPNPDEFDSYGSVFV